MRKTIFIKNAVILTASSLILRFVGIFFKVWLASKIGSEGIGLYQLIFSVYMFSATFATSGICTAVTRLVSEELVVGNKENVSKILRRCIQLSLVIAAFSIAVLFFGARFISCKLLHQPQAELSLKILGFSLPFMGVCSCFKGYFIARRKVSPTTTSQLLEQTVRIAVIVPLVLRYNSFGIRYACAAVLLGDTIAEAASCLYVYARYKADYKRLSLPPRKRAPYRLLATINHIALPITSGKYLNSALRMIENILVPICISSSTLSGNGMAMFGMIKGMALPLLFFPSTILSALSTLLLPEISESAVRGRTSVVKTMVNSIIKLTSIVSIIFSAVFLVCGKPLGVLIYKNPDVGFLLSALSPIVPFMYLDAISDGILKGLDQQKFTFYTSVIDSSIRILLILLLLKRFGIYGFIGIMYFSNFLTGFSNTKRLLKQSKANLDFGKVFFLPTCCAFTLCLLARYIFTTLNLSALPYVILVCSCCIPVYLLLLFAFNVIDYDDIGFIKIK